MKTLYIVDRTARQYPFMVNGQLLLVCGDKEIEFDGSEESVNFLYELVVNSQCFMIKQGENINIFRGENLIGANVLEN